MTVARFRLVAGIEAVTWIAMLAAMVATRAFAVGWAVPVMGPVHGIAFLVYLACVLTVRAPFRWDGTQTALALVSALVPGGAWLIVDRRLLAGRR